MSSATAPDLAEVEVAKRYPEDHPIEALRGAVIPGRTRMVRSLKERMGFLAVMIEVRCVLDRSVHRETGELAGIVEFAAAAGIAPTELVLAPDDPLTHKLASFRTSLFHRLSTPRDAGATVAPSAESEPGSAE